MSAAAQRRTLGRRMINVAMTLRQALAFIRRHGVVLEAAQGPVPSVAEAIAGEPVRRSWWSHPKSHEIFAVTRATATMFSYAVSSRGRSRLSIGGCGQLSSERRAGFHRITFRKCARCTPSRDVT